MRSGNDTEIKLPIKMEKREKRGGREKGPPFFWTQIPGKHLQSGHFLIY